MPYATHYRRWTSGRRRLNINGYGMPKSWLVLVRKAMNAWTAAGARFQFTEDPLCQSSVVYEHLDKRNAWVGLTSLLPTDCESNILQVLVRLNAEYTFTPAHPDFPPQKVSPPYDLYTVILHELGHALSLGEDYGINSDTIMRPTLKPGEVRGLASDDIRGIKFLYP